ncbi:type IV toxin-antitoxin system AbiEi family antitoxin domain-containing protein [Amorphus sp. MBR-141]
MYAILMGMSLQRQPRLKFLMEKVPPGFLVDTPWLKARGIDAKSIHDYVSRGRLERVIRGVYRRPLPDGVKVQPAVPWDSVLLSLQQVMNYDVHLGGVSALEQADGAHYPPLGGTPRVYLYGNVPTWLKRLPSNAQIIVHRRTLFGDDNTGIIDVDRDVQIGGSAVNVRCWPMTMSSPERAVLEALDELYNETSFEHLHRIFRSLTELRPKQLMTQLMACRTVKVRRLFFVFADHHQHVWRKHLDVDKISLGSGPRALVAGGKFHPTYRITVPKEFVPQDADADA